MAKPKYCGVYDIKDNELCVDIDTYSNIANKLGVSLSNVCKAIKYGLTVCKKYKLAEVDIDEFSGVHNTRDKV